MDSCPAELWLRIFAFACTDDGYTGRSLSRVSRYVRDVSLPVQLQSIALGGAYELKSFANTLESRPWEHRRVLHLYIANHKRQGDRLSYPPLTVSMDHSEVREALIYRQYHPSDEGLLMSMLPADDELRKSTLTTQRLIEERNRAFTRHLHRVMQGNSTQLRTLTLHVGPAALGSRWQGYLPPSSLLAKYDFPRLQELTVVDDCVFPGGSQAHVPLVLPVLPSLKRLHLVGCYNHLVAFLDAAPSLSHLRLSGATQLPPEIVAIVRGLVDVDAAEEAAHASHPRLVNLQTIIISPNSQTRTATYRGVTQHGLQELARRNDKVILLRSDRAATYGLPEARRDWLQRIEGKDGCWGYRTQDRDPGTVQDRVMVT